MPEGLPFRVILKSLLKYIILIKNSLSIPTIFRGWWSHYCGLTSLNGEYVPKVWGDGYGLFFTVGGQYVINPKWTRMMVRDRRED